MSEYQSFELAKNEGTFQPEERVLFNSGLMKAKRSNRILNKSEPSQDKKQDELRMSQRMESDEKQQSSNSQENPLLSSQQLGDSEFKDINISNLKKSKLRYTQNKKLSKLKKSDQTDVLPTPQLFESQIHDLPVEEEQKEVKKKKKKQRKFSRKTKKDSEDLI